MAEFMGEFNFPYTDFGEKKEQTTFEFQNTVQNINTLDFSDVIDRTIAEVQNPRVIKEYIYMDENSNPVFKIQEQTSGEPFVVMGYKNGEFEYGMNGVKKCPYNVPDLINARNRVVFIVNGEDKAEFLKELGFIATTAPFGGPIKWKEDYNKYLQIAGKALIVQDNSENGNKFAKNTIKTVQKALGDNVGRINLARLASKFNIQIQDNTSLMKFREILADDSLIKGAFEALEKAMLVRI